MRNQDFSLALLHPPLRSKSAGGNVSGWLLCFVSFTMLLFNQWTILTGNSYLPQIDIALFLAPWIWIFLRQQGTASRNVLSNWPLYMLPMLALISTIWSDYPWASLRYGFQYLMTVIVGVLAGSCIKPRLLISALLCALTLATLVGLLRSVGADYEDVMTGLFASKNYFALTISILLLIGLATALDRSQLWPFRLLGLIAAAGAPVLLALARSAGATVVSLIAVLATFAMSASARLRPEFRVALICLLALLLVTFIVLASFNLDEFSNVLSYFGKDMTLTGRIFLWEHALKSIGENPILGVGYQAYWQIGSPGAEELWAYAKVGKYGFHFHNTYLQVAVDLGLTGLFILLMTYFVIGVRAIRAVFVPRPTIEVQLAIALFICGLLRTPLEVDSLFPFQIPTILLCLSWVYLKERVTSARSGRRRASGRIEVRSLDGGGASTEADFYRRG
jgi:exopolysaccharide production protein ExoQ